jgi:hypothetical protein
MQARSGFSGSAVNAPTGSDVVLKILSGNNRISKPSLQALPCPNKATSYRKKLPPTPPVISNFNPKRGGRNRRGSQISTLLPVPVNVPPLDRAEFLVRHSAKKHYGNADIPPVLHAANDCPSSQSSQPGQQVTILRSLVQINEWFYVCKAFMCYAKR